MISLHVFTHHAGFPTSCVSAQFKPHTVSDPAQQLDGSDFNPEFSLIHLANHEQTAFSIGVSFSGFHNQLASIMGGARGEKRLCSAFSHSKNKKTAVKDFLGGRRCFALLRMALARPASNSAVHSS